MSKKIVFVHDNIEYNFHRQIATGEGNWCYNKRVGEHYSGMVVSRVLAAELTKRAIESGLTEIHNFNRTFKAPEKQTKVRGKRGPKNNNKNNVLFELSSSDLNSIYSG